MDKHTNKPKVSHKAEEEKKRLPIYAVYGLIALAALIVIAAGIFIYFSITTSYVATIDGTKISVSEYKYYFETQKSSMLQSAQQDDPNLNQSTFWSTKIGGETVLNIAKDKALASLKQLKIQLIKAKEAGVTLTATEIKAIDDSIDTNIIQPMGSGSRTKANIAFQKKYGISIDDVRKMQIEVATAQKYAKDQMDTFKVAQSDIKTYYDKNPDWYKTSQMRPTGDEAVWARHILISVASDATQADKDAAKKKAEDIVAKLKGGADFATLVKDNSEDPGSNTSGGDYVFSKGQMLSEFETAAFNLTPGAYTETPVLTTAGYHIIQLIEKYAKDQPVSLKCATEFREFGTTYIQYELYMQKLDGWEKDSKYKPVMNTQVYNSIN